MELFFYPHVLIYCSSILEQIIYNMMIQRYFFEIIKTTEISFLRIIMKVLLNKTMLTVVLSYYLTLYINI